MMLGAGDGDAGGIGLDFDFVVGKIAGHTGMNLDVTSHARVESQVQLAGDDLYNGDVSRVAHLLRGKVEGSFARFDVGEVDFGMDLIRLQSEEHTSELQSLR